MDEEAELMLATTETSNGPLSVAPYKYVIKISKYSCMKCGFNAILIRGCPKNLEEKDGQMQLLCYVSLIRACNKVL